MTTQTVDTAMAKRLVQALAVRGASIIGQPGGWSVILKIGTTEQALGAQRTNKPRTWRSLDRCVEYLKTELHLARFELLDATQHSDVELVGNSRSDTSERMRQTHQAAAYDKWFRAEVSAGVKEANDANTKWVPNSTVMAESAKRRAAWRKSADAQKGNT